MFEVFGFTVSKVSVILFVVAVGFGLTVVVWRQVSGIWSEERTPCGMAVLRIFGSGAFIAGSVVMLIAVWGSPPEGSEGREAEDAARLCASYAGIKIADVQHARLAPDEQVLLLPWGGDTAWSYNELAEIGCGRSRG